MVEQKYEKLKLFIKEFLINNWSVRDLVAEVHNLYQDYLISEKQEEELYKMVDPDDVENSPADLWYRGYGCVKMWEFANNL